MNYILLLFLAILPVNITAMDFIRGLFSHSRVTAQKKAVEIKNENTKNLEAYRAKWKHLIEKKPEAPLLLYTFLSTTKCSKDFTPKKEENKKYRDMQREKFAQGQDAKKLNDFDAVVVGYPEDVTQNSLSCNDETKQFILKRTEYKTASFVDSIKKYFWPHWWHKQHVKKNYEEYCFVHHQENIKAVLQKIDCKIATLKKSWALLSKKNSAECQPAIKSISERLISYEPLLRQAEWLLKDFTTQETSQKGKEPVYLHKSNPSLFCEQWLTREQSTEGKLRTKKDIKFFYQVFHGDQIDI